MKKEHQWRYLIIGVLFAVMGVVIVLQILRLQNSDKAQELLVYEDPWIEKTIYPTRGQIYDRWGHLLAGNHKVYEIGLELREIETREDAMAIADAVSTYIGTDKQFVFQQAIVPFIDKEQVYMVVDDFVSADKVQALEEYIKQYKESAAGDPDKPSLDAIVTSAHLERSYPENDLASNLIGFVSRRDRLGYFGVEEYYHDALAGEPQTILVTNDPSMVAEVPDIPPGSSLVLTIDREIQAMAEEVLDQAIEQMGAKTGTIGIMDPRTGEILAFATTPRWNLNEYWQYDQREFPNRGVGYPYETGSVFKVLTMAAALDQGIVEPNTTFVDQGIIEVGGIYIRNWTNVAHGPVTMTECMQLSLNVCLAHLGLELGPPTFYSYLQNFGIGKGTGVDLAGEVTGIYRDTSHPDWYWADLGTNTFGQGVSSTVVQMLKATSALANDGEMVQPHIVKAMVTDGKQHPITVLPAGTPISAETAHTLTDMLYVSLQEESSEALVSGYSVAGKTGTGEIATDEGYTLEITNASFVGWGPIDDPKFLVYVWLEQPTTSIWGSKTAAPVFARVVERLVVLMNIPPDDQRLAIEEVQTEVQE